MTDASSCARSASTSDPLRFRTAPGSRRGPFGVAQLITDAGSADLHGGGTEAKDLDHAEWKKSRSVWFTVSS